MAPQQQAAFSAEAGNGLARDELPAYAPMLTAYHRAAAADLAAMIAELPIAADAQILDMACGDGVYSVWLAERVGAQGQVVGVDVDQAYLEVARNHAEASHVAERISFQTGDIHGLPFADDTFDLVWCAHSLYSLPDPVAALREMGRVVRRGGAVAILENDTLHHMLLPWPVEFELAVRSAQHAALKAGDQPEGKFYIGRHMCSTFELAGLEQCRITTHALSRRAPLSPAERMWLQLYLEDVRERAWPYLDPAARAACDLLLNPDSRLYLLDRPDFFMSHLEIVGCAVKL